MNKKEALIYVLETGNPAKCVCKNIEFAYSEYFANTFYHIGGAKDGGDKILNLQDLPNDAYYKKLREEG